MYRGRKFTARQIIDIRTLSEYGFSNEGISRMLGIPRITIYKIISRQIYKEI